MKEYAVIFSHANSVGLDGYDGLNAVDHCHRTGRVRGFLCSRCNLILGNAADDPARLRSAADYLESPGVQFLPGFKNKGGAA